MPFQIDVTKGLCDSKMIFGVKKFFIWHDSVKKHLQRRKLPENSR